MAVVLCIGVNPLLIATRKMILERAGHTAFTATNERELKNICAEHHLDVVVVGQRVPAREKRRVLTLVRDCTAGAKVLELYEQGGGRILEDADDWLLVPTDAPGDLVTRVEALIVQNEKPQNHPSGSAE
jgi:DNA-binding response OmpR family regulator